MQPTEETFDSLKLKVDKLTLIHQISRSIVKTLNYEELIQNVSKFVLDAVKAEACSFWIKEVETQENLCKVALGPTKDQILNLRLPKGKGIVGWCIDNKKSSVVFDTSTDQRFSQEVDQKTSFKTKSMICVPLVVDNQSFGALQFINKNDQKTPFFNQDDLDIIISLAEQANIAIKNAQLYESQKKIKDLTAILQLSKEITSTLDIDRVLLSVVNLTSQIVHYHRGIIALIDGEKIVLGAISGEETIDQNKSENSLAKALLKEIGVLKTDVMIERNKEAELSKPCQDYFAAVPEIKALWATPLRDGEGTVGALFFESQRENFIEKRQFDILQILANQTTVALRNSLLYSQTPTANLFGRLEGKKQSIFYRLFWKTSLRKKITVSVLIILLVAIVIPLPRRVISDCEIVAQNYYPVYSMSSGLIASIPELIQYGATIEQGDVLAILDPFEIKSELDRLQKRFLLIQSQIRQLRFEGNRGLIEEQLLEEKKIQSLVQEKEYELSLTEIRSPVSGRLLTRDIDDLFQKSVSKGEQIFEIAKDAKSQLKLYVGHDEIGSVKLGQPVRFFLAGFPMQSFLGIVTHISPVSEPKGDFIVFSVEASIQKGPDSKDLLVGMKGRSSILLDPQILFLTWTQKMIFLIKKILYF